MAIVTGDRYLDSLVKFVEQNAGPLIEGSLVLKLNPVGLRYVQSRLEALAELESLLAGAPVDYLRAYVSDLGDHRALEQLRRILRLLPSLKVVSVLPPPARDPTPPYLLPFARLKVLELRGCDLSTSAAKGLLELRHTLEKLICHNSTDALRHVFASRILEIKSSAQWKRLSFVSCACNGLVLMDESLQLLPVVETLDLSRNKFAKVDNLRKCTKLKHLDLGFNNLRSISSFCEIACQIVKLVLRNNALTTLHGVENLRSLEGLDISYNIISNFSEIVILAGLPSLQSLWLEGNPLCCARWFRAQVFSLFPHPDRLMLDEKRISTEEFWKLQIIVASRQKHPSSFGFYSPAKGDTEIEGVLNTKRKKISRLVSIESEEQSIHLSSDQDSVSCDNEIQSKEENAVTDEEAEITDLMRRIENMKRERSVLWLQEFKEWLNHGPKNFLDGGISHSGTLDDNEEVHIKSDAKDVDLGESSRYVSDSVQLSGDESTTVLESDTSFLDASTIASAQRFHDRIVDATSKLFLGNSFGDGDIIRSMSLKHQRLLSADARDLDFNPLMVMIGDGLTPKNVIAPSMAINDIMSRSSSAFPGSPPHYQKDILHRRHNLEEEFLQLSAESLSVASSDSNTTCSDDDSAVGPSIPQVDQSTNDSLSTRRLNGFFPVSHPDDADHDKISLLKINGVQSSGHHAEENHTDAEIRDVNSSSPACGIKYTGGVHDDRFFQHWNDEADWLEKKKYKRKSKKRMVSLQEEEDVAGGTDLLMKSDQNVDLCRNGITDDKNELCRTSDSPNSMSQRNCKSIKTEIDSDYQQIHSSISDLDGVGKDDAIKRYFNLNMANCRVNETCVQHTCCKCLLPEKSGYAEREIAILRTDQEKLYVVFIVNAWDGSGVRLEFLGCHGVGDVREVFVGLGLQVLRVCFEGNTTYLFITRSVETSRKLLAVLDLIDMYGTKENCTVKSLEKIQFYLFQEQVCGSSKINVYQYAMVLFWRNNLKEGSWLGRSLFMLEDHLLICTEDILEFGSLENASSPSYFQLDSCCAIADIYEMVVDPMNSLCVTLFLENASEFHPSVENAVRKVKPVSDPITWRLKWDSERSVSKFVTLVKAMHTQATSVSLNVKYTS